MVDETCMPEFIHDGPPVESHVIVGGPKDPLVAVLESLQAQIESLDNRLTKQEAEITKLKARAFSLEGGPTR